MNLSNQKTPNGVSILVVDDDLLVREGTILLAKRMGYTVVGEAANGLEAVSLSNTLKPDVVLMDVNMPRMNGLQAAPLCWGKVIIITGDNTAAVLKEAKMAGAVTCLHKPLHPPDLQQAVVEVVPA